ncbi:uncharacterized protein L203_100282 [Cryptococcus depauperatus CBS 7841]|uniref:Mid2 domain-containing protein n=1 Tax=Cryptococcus depauperatus CBS 7841 TaxID=1295531 RepID=A0AAJ8LWT3_9TREE
MHLPTLALLLLSTAIAHPHESRRHHARAMAVADANRAVPRAGGVIDDGALASKSEQDAAGASKITTSARNSDIFSGTISNAPPSSGVSSSTPVISAIPSSAVNSGDSPSSGASSVISATGIPSTTLSQSTPSTVITNTASSSTTTSPATSQTTANSAKQTPTTISDTNSGLSNTGHSTVVLVTTASKPSHVASSTASSAADKDHGKSSSGLSKSALIAIIVVASVVGLVAIGWTAFRKWKLRPSNRFDSKMQPIDFSPQKDGGMDDDFFEKTLQRSASQNSTNRQRQELVAQLDDPNHVPGVPTHDFTAGAAVGAGVGAYGYQDQYAEEQQYEYDQYNQYAHGYEHAYPPQPSHVAPHGYDYSPDIQNPAVAMTSHPDGYADLQRGPSNGSGSDPAQAYTTGSGENVVNANVSHAYSEPGQAIEHETAPQPQLQFPSAEQYTLSRPTQGAEGLYAQAANYRH